ncbi:MAG: hypothetical protein COB02_17175 [Candidatus Cloacimonadota bacterium]|nr:MAG: hypothetical protein COB02_17175 [Candidatus Cloacimonadota bacterium]
MQKKIQNSTDIKIGSTIAIILALVIVFFAVFFLYQSSNTQLDEPIIRKTKDIPQIIDVLEIPQDIKIVKATPEKLLAWADLLKVYHLQKVKPDGFKSALLKNLSLSSKSSDLNISLLEFENISSTRDFFYRQMNKKLKWVENEKAYVIDGLSYRAIGKYIILSEYIELIALKKYLSSIYKKLKLSPLRLYEGKHLIFSSKKVINNSHIIDLESYVFLMGSTVLYLSDLKTFDKKLSINNSTRKYSIGNLSIQRLFNSNSSKVVYLKRGNDYVLYTKPLNKHLSRVKKSQLIKLFR